MVDFRSFFTIIILGNLGKLYLRLFWSTLLYSKTHSRVNRILKSILLSDQNSLCSGGGGGLLVI